MRAGPGADRSAFDTTGNACAKPSAARRSRASRRAEYPTDCSTRSISTSWGPMAIANLVEHVGLGPGQQTQGDHRSSRRPSLAIVPSRSSCKSLSSFQTRQAPIHRICGTIVTQGTESTMNLRGEGGSPHLHGRGIALTGRFRPRQRVRFGSRVEVGSLTRGRDAGCGPSGWQGDLATAGVQDMSCSSRHDLQRHRR